MSQIELTATHCCDCGQKPVGAHRVGGYLVMPDSESVRRVNAVHCEDCLPRDTNRFTCFGAWEPCHGLRVVLPALTGRSFVHIDLLDNNGCVADKTCMECGHVYAPTCKCKEL